MPAPAGADVAETAAARVPRHQVLAFAAMVGVLVAAPFFVYPVFLMKALCFALFACAFNLLIGYVGLLSFGHAAFLGSAGYVAAHAAKMWGWPPELAILAGVAAAAALGVVVGARGGHATAPFRRGRPASGAGPGP
jgi:branched-chain amino acid transport system permease protein